MKLCCVEQKLRRPPLGTRADVPRLETCVGAALPTASSLVPEDCVPFASPVLATDSRSKRLC